MIIRASSSWLFYSILVLGMFAVSGCVSLEKKKAPIFPDPSAINAYRPLSMAAEPSTEMTTSAIGVSGARQTSLWSSSPKSLFGDRRASQLGDLLTVLIEIDEEAEFSNSVTRDRQSSKNSNMRALLGLPEIINERLPGTASVTPAIDIDRTSNSSGNGQIKRGEKITLRLAAQVVNVLPNGYLQLAGQQQIRVNHEVRELQVTGIIRTEDISRLNVVTYDKIANARIYYGGEGEVSRAVTQKSGSRLIDKVIPF